MQYADPQKHQDQFTIVGILKPTNSPSDRVVWIPIEGIYRMTGHVLRGTGQIYRPTEGEEIPGREQGSQRGDAEVQERAAGFILDQQINRQGKVATLAWPVAKVMADLFDRIGWVSRILSMVAYLVVVVAAGLDPGEHLQHHERAPREFAILRALGARRSTVFSAIVLEAATITFLGALVGLSRLRRHPRGGVCGCARPDGRRAGRVPARCSDVAGPAGDDCARRAGRTGAGVQGIPHGRRVQPDTALVKDTCSTRAVRVAMVIALLWSAACAREAPPADASAPAAATAHQHHAPHGGILVELGEEFAQVELVLDPVAGSLTAYMPGRRSRRIGACETVVTHGDP